MSLLTKLFGNYSEKEIKRITPLQKQVLDLEEEYRALSDEELKAMSWTTFVAGCQEPELVQYLKERRLYINEPVDMDEEV